MNEALGPPPARAPRRSPGAGSPGGGTCGGSASSCSPWSWSPNRGDATTTTTTIKTTPPKKSSPSKLLEAAANADGANNNNSNIINNNNNNNHNSSPGPAAADDCSALLRRGVEEDMRRIPTAARAAGAGSAACCQDSKAPNVSGKAGFSAESSGLRFVASSRTSCSTPQKVWEGSLRADSLSVASSPSTFGRPVTTAGPAPATTSTPTGTATAATAATATATAAANLSKAMSSSTSASPIAQSQSQSQPQSQQSSAALPPKMPWEMSSAPPALCSARGRPGSPSIIPRSLPFSPASHCSAREMAEMMEVEAKRREVQQLTSRNAMNCEKVSGRSTCSSRSRQGTPRSRGMRTPSTEELVERQVAAKRLEVQKQLKQNAKHVEKAAAARRAGLRAAVAEAQQAAQHARSCSARALSRDSMSVGPPEVFFIGEEPDAAQHPVREAMSLSAPRCIISKGSVTPPRGRSRGC